MRASTILLTALTVVFGAGTVVFAVRVGLGSAAALAQVVRLGGVVTLGFGAAVLISVADRRRRERLRTEAGAHPGTVFVNAHATETTAMELRAWSPGLEVPFPCDLGFDRNGLASWSGEDGHERMPIASREEIIGFDVFDEPTPLGSTSRWGIAIRLAPRAIGPGTVRLWMLDAQPHQDEYAMRSMIARIESALGR